MPLSSMIPLLQAGRDNGYAIGQFNFHNMDGLLAILGAAEEKRSPVILGPLFLKPHAIMAMLRELAAEASVPVAVTLDHGQSFEQCVECIEAGYTDVMLDTSALDIAAAVAEAIRLIDRQIAQKQEETR